jgi:hypothetical protein
MVEDRLLDGPVEELVRVPAEELVERVVPGHVQREAGRAATRAAPHLPQARDGSREGHADGGVEVAHVDAQLERVGGDHGKELALGEPALDLTPLCGRIARAVRGDPLGDVTTPRVLEPQPCEALDQLDAAA